MPNEKYTSNTDAQHDRSITIQFIDTITTPEGMTIPDVLLLIQRVWEDRANRHGDGGEIVIGAIFTYTYGDRNYMMPPVSKWTGCLSWEHCITDIHKMLELAGARNIHYDRGVIDYEAM